MINIEGGTVHFGDTAIISPKSSSKSSAGAGGANTGFFVSTFNGFSLVNTLDPNVIDQPTIGNY